MAVKTVTVLSRQTIYDIAVQEYGSTEGVIQLIKDNPELNLVNNLYAGQLLKINAGPVNKLVADYFKSNDLHPATQIITTSNGGDFNNDFNNDFNT